MEHINLDELGTLIFGPSRPMGSQVDTHDYIIVKMTYEEYLKTPHWLMMRGKIKARDGHKCVLCASRNKLEVHHNCYDHLGYEPPEDLITLCDGCHEKHHKERI
jgi:5-methylcytosine-specific restriction endonuclease McrA